MRTPSYEKQKQKQKQKGNAPKPDISLQDWKQMVRWDSFEVRDKEGEIHTFNVGNHALILADDMQPDDDDEAHEFWVGHILEIRTWEQPDECEGAPDLSLIWVRVSWFWSGKDVHGIRPSFSPKLCAKYERLKSKSEDYVSAMCFNDITHVRQYKEEVNFEVEQEDIGPHEFFWRWNFEPGRKVVNPKPLSECFCKGFYNPDNDDMHFCPRPACRRAYHTRCLLSRPDLKDREPHTRPDRLLASSPDSDKPIPVDKLHKRHMRSQRRARRSPTAASGRTSDDDDSDAGMDEEDEEDENFPEPSVEMVLNDLPQGLLAAARHPIVRGKSWGGVVGNVRYVVAARRIVLAVLRGPYAVPNDWEEKVHPAAATYSGTYFHKKRPKCPAVLCPNCRHPI